MRTVLDLVVLSAAAFALPAILVTLAANADYDRTVVIGVLIAVGVVWLAFVGPKVAERANRLLALVARYDRPAASTVRLAAELVVIVGVGIAGFFIEPPPFVGWAIFALATISVAAGPALGARVMRQVYEKTPPADRSGAFNAWSAYWTLVPFAWLGVATAALAVAAISIGPFGTDPPTWRAVLSTVLLPVSFFAIWRAHAASIRFRSGDPDDPSTYATL